MAKKSEVRVELASLKFEGNKVQLEELCKGCNGSGINPEYRKPKILDFFFGKQLASRNCQVCNGSGVQLTPNGKQLIKFVFNNLGIAGTSSMSIYQVPLENRK